MENAREETDGMTQTVKDRIMNSTHKLCAIHKLWLCIIYVDVTYTYSDKVHYRVYNILCMYIHVVYLYLLMYVHAQVTNSICLLLQALQWCS